MAGYINYMKDASTVINRMAEIRKERTIRERELKRVDRVLRATKRMRDAEESWRVVDKPNSTMSIVKIRHRVNNAVVLTQDVDGLASPNATSDLMSLNWFDLRGFCDHIDMDMAIFGMELVAEGILKLPYDECVFIIPAWTEKEGHFTRIDVYEQGDRCIWCTKSGAVFRDGAGVMADFESSRFMITEVAYPNFYLAAMSSRATQLERRSIRTDKPVPIPASKEDTYTVVSLRGSAGGGDYQGGTHASPRLHWRRGHIRRLGDKTTWVRPTLVGSSDAGTVVHDYKAKD